MPSTDQFSSMSGRNSRASNVSCMTGTSRSYHGRPPNRAPNETLNPAVLDMLKTSTDTGGIGMPWDYGRTTTTHRSGRPQRDRPKASRDLAPFVATRPPMVHHNSMATANSLRSHQVGKVRHRGSVTSLQSMPPTLRPVDTYNTLSRRPSHMPISRNGNRAYSLTSTPTDLPIPHHQSVTSLKAAYRGPGGPFSSKRSNITGTSACRLDNNREYLRGHAHRSHSSTSFEFPHSTLIHRQAPIGKHTGSEAPRSMIVSHAYMPDAPKGYMQPVRTPKELPPRRETDSRVEQGSRYSSHAQRTAPTTLQAQARDRSNTALSTNDDSSYWKHFPTPPSNRVPQMQRPAISPENLRELAARAHHTFHHAAKQVCMRSGTPLTESESPGTERPSSGTAPSSTPSTPDAYSSVHAVIDPITIRQTSTEFPYVSIEADSLQEHMFSEGATVPAIEPSAKLVTIGSVYDSPPQAIPPYGYVRKVKSILESKVQCDDGVNSNPRPADNRGETSRGDVVLDEIDDVRETPAEILPNDAPPTDYRTFVTSGTRPGEQHAKLRLTRDVIKAELDASNTTSCNSQIVLPTKKCPSAVQVEQNVEKLQSEFVQWHQIDLGDPKVETAEAPNVISCLVQPTEYSYCDPKTSVLPVHGQDREEKLPSWEAEHMAVIKLDADTLTMQQRNPHEITLTADDQPLENENLQRAADLKDSFATDDAVQVSAGRGLLVEIGNNKRKSCSSPDQPLLEGYPTKEDEGNIGNHGPEDIAVTSPDPITILAHPDSSSLVLDDASSSNRLSFPTDFTSTANTTTDNTSEAVTDIAVRFSLPRANLTTEKPQVVAISPSNSLRKIKASSLLSESASMAGENAPRQNSVLFIDEVPPLNIKKTLVLPSVRKSPNAMVGTTKSILRKSLIHTEAAMDFSRSYPTTASTFTRGLCENALPNLTEESIEEANNNRKRSSGCVKELDCGSSQVEVRIAESAQDECSKELAETPVRPSTYRYNQRLSQIRDLPSLNFSRTNLIDKLNAALQQAECRKSQCIEHVDAISFHCRSLSRSRSSRPSRDRYVSFFKRPEDFSLFEVMQHRKDVEHPHDDPSRPVIAVQESSELQEQSRSEHTVSTAQDLLDVASQVNRLSIPSVNRLSERLSEILPCLRNLHLEGVLDTQQYIEQMMSNTRQLDCIQPRRETMVPMRTSAGFKLLAEQENQTTNNTINDSLAIATPRINTSVVPDSASADNVLVVGPAEEKPDQLRDCVSAPPGLRQGHQWRDSFIATGKTPTTAEEVLELLPPERNPLIRHSNRTGISSFIGSRPWNLDTSYPWSTSDLNIKLVEPASLVTDKAMNEQGRPLSKGIMPRTESSSQHVITASIDTTSSGKSGDLTQSTTSKRVTGTQVPHYAEWSEASVRGPCPNPAETSGHRLSHSPTCNLHRDNEHCVRVSIADASEDSRPHRPGDRYPTSALFTPANYNLDEVRSFFSDDSSEEGGNVQLRKRLTGFRYRGIRVNSTETRGSADAAYGMVPPDGGQMYSAGNGATDVARPYGEMPHGRADFRLRRIGEKLRGWIVRGGMLLRTWTVARATQRTRRLDEWLNDSLYSNE